MESKLFDDIDTDLKVLLYDAEKTPHVVEACVKPGLEDKLNGLKDGLNRCEKRLDEYLETKKKGLHLSLFALLPPTHVTSAQPTLVSIS